MRIAATLLALALATGCGKRSEGDDDGPTGPTTPPPPIVYSALGASDALGVGSSVVCPPYTDCPNGTSYVYVATRQLQSRGYTVTVTNHGIPTGVISRAFQNLGQQHGRAILGNIIEHAMPFIPRATTLVTVFTGGNEVNVITAALGGGAGAADQAAYIDQQVRNFGADFATLIAGIRSAGNSPRLIVLNVPNLGALPSLAGATLPQRQAAQRASVRMTTTVINPLAAQNITVVDLMCDARLYQAANLSSDGFHPNDAGYAIIASALVNAVTSASYPAPASSCPQMTLVP